MLRIMAKQRIKMYAGEFKINKNKVNQFAIKTILLLLRLTEMIWVSTGDVR